MIQTLVFDIGGTRTRIAIIDPMSDQEIQATTFKTPKNPKEAMVEMSDHVYDLVDGNMDNFQAAAGGIAGVLDQDNHSLVHGSNLPEWVGFPLWKSIKKFVNCPVYLENDSSMVGLGEASAGAGTMEGIMAYITESTGVGGTRIVNGYIDMKTYGFEPGHHIINHITGETWQDLASGSGLMKQYGLTPKEVTDPDIWDALTYASAVGIYNMILFWSPETVVLGGGFLQKDDNITIGGIIKTIESFPKIFPRLPNIVMGTTGDIGGLYGAREVLRQTAG